MADVELLPLPEHFAHQSERVQEHVRAYARANLASLQAEIERLRAEVAEWKRVAAAQAELHGEAEDRAERLEEALREARDAIEDWAGYASDYFREKHDLAGDLAKIDALLRDQEEGT